MSCLCDKIIVGVILLKALIWENKTHFSTIYCIYNFTELIALWDIEKNMNKNLILPLSDSQSYCEDRYIEK